MSLEATAARSFGSEVLSVATSHPEARYTQREIIDTLEVRNSKLVSIFENAHIDGRYLVLPPKEEQRPAGQEPGIELWNKHRTWGLRLGEQAILRALERANVGVADIDYLVCVTSTGFLCPGLSAHLIERLGLRRDVHRVDVVGMGCNAGLNALQPLANFCKGEPGRVGVQVCVEVCSAAYVTDGSVRNTVVNSLFGDGAAAIVVQSRNDNAADAPRLELLGFTSHIVTEAIDAMRFDYDGSYYSFFLGKNIPYTIGENAEVPVDALLHKHGLKRRDIAHWIVHSGGKKVIDAIKASLGLSNHDMRHTLSVLKQYGNVSSGSFLFSLEKLLEERVIAKGDHVVLMTMGPGSSIECCLGRF